VEKCRRELDASRQMGIEIGTGVTPVRDSTPRLIRAWAVDKRDLGTREGVITIDYRVKKCVWYKQSINPDQKITPGEIGVISHAITGAASLLRAPPLFYPLLFVKSLSCPSNHRFSCFVPTHPSNQVVHPAHVPANLF